jgi:hypothetical protein
MRIPPLPPIDELKRFFAYDARTGLITRRLGMSQYPRGSVAGSRQHDYIYVEYHRCRILAHRLAWALYYGDWPNGDLDHINFDRMDNRIENLRIASVAANQRNRGVQSNSSTGIKGVTRHKQTGKYMAKISLNKKATYLGIFDDPHEAAHAYNRAAIRLHGEFARLNPIGEDYAR